MKTKQRWGRCISVAAIASAVLAWPTAAEANTRGMVALLNGHQENPPVDTAGEGCARFEIDTEKNVLRYRISYCGLSGDATAAHIHGPADIGQNAGVAHGFASPTNPIVGEWNYPEPMEANILAGRMYVNVHTAANPGGEIRGQIVDMVAKMTGDQENPPTGSTGAGYGLFQLDTFNDELDYHIVVESLDGTENNQHIHGMALHTSNAGVLHPLPAGSPKTGTYNYAAGLEDSILNGLMYVNIHSTRNPGGEIRGQVTRYVEPLDSGQEVPPNDSEGCGCAFIAREKDDATLSYRLQHGSLSGPATAAHIHGFAGPGENAGVQQNVGTDNPTKGTWEFGAANAEAVDAGRTYFNVHTADNPGGEIRGQVMFASKPCPTDLDCNGATGFNDLLDVLANWGPYEPCPPHRPQDIDRNCDVGFSDLLEVLANWGDCD